MTDALARPLEGRHAIVTGGARGIGLAIARRCLANGASVALWDVEAATLADAVAQLAPLGTVVTALVDVRDEVQIARAASQSQERFGRVDILVNNAGVLGPTVPAWEHTPAQWRHVLDINLTGAWLCSAADTAVFADVPAEHREQLRTALLSRVPMGRFVDVDEVAAMAAWLASDECSFSTGAVFDISGGRSMY